MLKISLAALLTLGALFCVAEPAAARDYAYCLQSRELGYPGNCQFRTYRQCMATASGTNASCGINPRVAARRQHRNY